MAVDEDIRVHAERVSRLYSRTNLGIFASIVNSLILAAFLYKVISHLNLIIWLATIVVACFFRWLIFRRYKHLSVSPVDSFYWKRQILCAVFLSGISWGLVGIIAFPANSFVYQVFIAFVVGGMVAGAAGVYYIIIKAFIVFSLTALLPIIIRFFLIGNNLHLAMGTMTLLFGVMMFFSARNNNKLDKKSIAIEFKNADLILNLRSEKKIVKKINEKLEKEIIAKRRAEAKSLRDKMEAEAANRAKSEFLTNMSHELRTPLNHIIGFTELVVDKNFGDLNATQEEYLGDVLTSSWHLLSLINDILDLSKVEAGKLEFDPTDVNLKALLENSLTMIKEKAMNHGIQLSTDIHTIPETITADERKLKQIIYNLLSNAVKFTPKGGEICLMSKKVTLDDPKMMNLKLPETRHLKSESEDFIEISVIDTGIGIKQEDLERIFNPFEQVDYSARRKYQGTGLGLALTRQLVELHGGRIWAESEGEGKGSTFWFAIPNFSNLKS